MTVSELIKELEKCEMPDAEVRLGAKWRDADGAMNFGATVLATDVSRAFESVVIDGLSVTEKER